MQRVLVFGDDLAMTQYLIHVKHTVSALKQ